MTAPAELAEKVAARWQQPENSGRINALLDDLLERARHGRQMFEREWYLQCLAYGGHHWVIWDRQRGQWRMKKGPKWFPRPVTNRVAEHVDDNVSSLIRNPPELSWLPTDDDPESIAAADVADRIDEVIVEETGRFRNARQKAAWAVTTGDCFVESGYDKSPEHGTVFVAHHECLDCGMVAPATVFKQAEGTCPGCQSENIEEARERIGMACPVCGTQAPYDEQLAFGPCPICEERLAVAQPPMLEGALAPPAPELSEVPQLRPIYGDKKIGSQEPRGKLWERVRSPFEVFYDLRTVRSFDKEGGLRWVITRELMDADEAKRQYPGIPLNEETSGEGHKASLSLQYLESLAVLTGILDPENAKVLPGPSGVHSPRVLRECLYHLPTEEFPEGLIAIRLNAYVIAETTPLPYHDSDGNPFISIVHIPFKKQPGRVPGRTFTSDIIPLNRTRNETESMMMLAERRMANPVNLIPDGSMDRMPTGEPGENWIYKALSAGNGRAPTPNRLPGVEPSMYFERRLQGLDQQAERLAGSFAVAHGEAPRGVTAASALALLGERQERAVSPQVQAWEQAHEQIARQQMYIFKEYATEPRVRPIKDAMSKWEFESWSNADLGGNITVKVEPGSATPKSNAQMRATIEALLKTGMIDPADPEMRRRIFQIMGTTTLIQHQDLDTKDAQEENDRFLRAWTGEQGAEPLRFRAIIDNHVIHLAEHIKLAKQDTFREIERAAHAGDPRAQAMVAELYTHIEAHMQALAPPPEPAEGQPGDTGPGRPEGSGSVFSAGRKDVPATERAIAEPGASAQEGLR